ncbi:hypothetical protein, partial [Pseudomonas aeruginosa]|uniref:hypothetical protein n=1 Tax=Pseudomonas aeruginosa TaxID=287 RepID=UPI001C6574D5
METYATSVHIADGSYVLDAIGFAVPVYVETDGTLKDFVIQRATPTENFAGMVGTEFSSNADLLATALATYASGKTLSTTPALHGENSHALLIKPIFRPGAASDGTRDPDAAFLGVAFA